MVYRVRFDTIRKGWLLNFTLAPLIFAHSCAKKSSLAFISRLFLLFCNTLLNRGGDIHTFTVTLPTASSYVGRSLTFQNYQNQLLVSSLSNVVPLSGGAAGVDILNDVAGDWATLVSDGTNWVVMIAASNNFEFLVTESNESITTENDESLILNT